MKIRLYLVIAFCLFVFCGFEYPAIENDTSIESALEKFSGDGHADYPQGDPSGLRDPVEDMPGTLEEAQTEAMESQDDQLPDPVESTDLIEDMPETLEEAQAEAMESQDYQLPDSIETLDPTSDMNEPVDYSYIGTWILVSATMDGAPIDKGRESLIMKRDSYTSIAGCTVLGSLKVKGNIMTMQAARHDCLGPVPSGMTQTFQMSKDKETVTFVILYGGSVFRNVFTRQGELDLADSEAENSLEDSELELAYPEAENSLEDSELELADPEAENSEDSELELVDP